MAREVWIKRGFCGIIVLSFDQECCFSDLRECLFLVLTAFTFGKSTGFASRILSAVQYLRVSSGEAFSECLTMVGVGAGFARRLHATRYTPTSKPSRTVAGRATRMSLCFCDIMPLSFIIETGCAGCP